MTERKNIVKALALLLVTVMTVTMLPVKMSVVEAGITPHYWSECNGNCGFPESDTSVHLTSPNTPSTPNTPSSSSTSTVVVVTPPPTTQEVVVSEANRQRAAEEEARAELERIAKEKDEIQRAKEEEIHQEEVARAAEAQKGLEEAKKESEQNAQLSTGGTVIKTTVDGAYTAKSVEGTAVTTSQEQLKENFGLKEGETVRVFTWDTTAKNSPDAMRSLEQAAKGIGGELGPAINVTIKKSSSKTNPALKTITKALLQDFKGIGPAVGAVNTDDWADYLSDKPDDQSFLAKYNEAMKETLKLDLNSENYANEVKAVFEKYGLGGPDEALSRLEDIRNEVDEFTKARGSAEMTVGVPQNFQSEGSTISVVKVLPGGKTEVLPDKDNNPNTVSFDVTEGEASYALVKKPISINTPATGNNIYGKGKYTYRAYDTVDDTENE